MRKFLFICSVFVVTLQLQAQPFQYDNVKYKTVFPEDLCIELAANPDYVLLDVRSDGEFYDTLSVSRGLNIGHLKNALHINISELAIRWKELEPYKNKPLFIYCSHSQRSRRASRMLADSGFVNIYNVNGGLTRLLMTEQSLGPCFEELHQTHLSYKIIAPQTLSNLTTAKNPFYIIDLRSDSTFRGMSQREKDRYSGKIRDAHNIPQEDIASSIASIPRNKAILLIDDYGDDSPGTASFLLEKGYTDISILFGGMDSWVDYAMNISQEPEKIWLPTHKNMAAKIISAKKMDEIAKSNTPLIIDIRPADQFSNESKNYWQNIGKIKTAVNVPFEEFDTKISSITASKNTTIILYAFNDQPELYESAQKLKALGYQDVNILYGGIWNLRWAGHNLQDQSYLADWITGIPPENQ